MLIFYLNFRDETLSLKYVNQFGWVPSLPFSQHFGCFKSRFVSVDCKNQDEDTSSNKLVQINFKTFSNPISYIPKDQRLSPKTQAIQWFLTFSLHSTQIEGLYFFCWFIFNIHSSVSHSSLFLNMPFHETITTVSVAFVPKVGSSLFKVPLLQLATFFIYNSSWWMIDGIP